ncbi:hypothetical protein ABZ883_04660 [Streptomyces sp. NPDC046977]|uniref:hypothetical protein n=1 Tax=Streptomyces sp. NPDC046977 TaxID=3154703 RepID=UPI00340612D6
MSARAVAPLVELLQIHASAVTRARPCLLVRHARRDGLIVPTGRNAGRFVGGFGRATVTEAELADLVVVGTTLRGVPEYECDDSEFWRWRRGTRGYAIALGRKALKPELEPEITP